MTLHMSERKEEVDEDVEDDLVISLASAVLALKSSAAATIASIPGRNT